MVGTKRLMVATIAALAVAPPAWASHGSEDGGPRDFAAGSARNVLFDVTPYPVSLAVSAHGFDAELPTLEGLFAGDRVSGHVTGAGELPDGAFRTQGEVTCLKVVGNRATIKYRFGRTQGPGAPPPGWGVQVFVEDNGPASATTRDGNATDLPLPPELFEPTADQCELPRGPYNPVDAGNYVVHDGD